jgi:hypothetical protein
MASIRPAITAAPPLCCPRSLNEEATLTGDSLNSPHGMRPVTDEPCLALPVSDRCREPSRGQTPCQRDSALVCPMQSREGDRLQQIATDCNRLQLINGVIGLQEGETHVRCWSAIGAGVTAPIDSASHLCPTHNRESLPFLKVVDLMLCSVRISRDKLLAWEPQIVLKCFISACPVSSLLVRTPEVAA